MAETPKPGQQTAPFEQEGSTAEDATVYEVLHEQPESSNEESQEAISSVEDPTTSATEEGGVSAGAETEVEASEEDSRTLDQQWVEYLRADGREKAIQDAVSAHKKEHIQANGDDSTWKYSDALTAVLDRPEVLEKIYSKDDLERGANKEADNKRYIKEAIRTITTERRNVRAQAKETRQRIAKIQYEGGEKLLELRKQEAEKFKDRLEEVTAAVSAARDTIPHGERGRLTTARRQALVEAGVYSEELARMLPRGYFEQLFTDAAALAEGKELEVVQSPPPKQHDLIARSEGDRSGQQLPVDGEQEKKDKITALINKIGNDKVDILKLVVAGKKPTDLANDADTSKVIRDTLKTLGILTDTDFDGLEDRDIASIVQEATPHAPVPPGGVPPHPSQGGRPPIPVAPGSPYPGPAPGQPQSPPPVPTPAPQVRIPMPPGTPYPGPAPSTSSNQNGNLSGTLPTVERTQHLDTMLTNVEASLLDRLDVARDKWAKISSKRQRRSLFGKLIARSRKYKESKVEYDTLSREAGRIGLKEKLDQAQTQLEKNAIATTYWITEQNAVREKAAAYTEDRTWWKVINRVSNYMDKGSKITRIAKRMTLGVAAGILASPIGLTGVAAGVTFFATEQMKNLAGGIKKFTPEEEAKLHNSAVSRVTTDDAIFENRAAMFAKMYEIAGKKESNRRLKTFGKNALKGAAAGALAYGVHEGISAGHDYIFGSNDASAVSVPNTDHSGTSPDVSAGGPVGPETSLGGSGNVLSPDTLSSAPSGHELLNSTDAFYVKPGEGWYETFQDMGIPKDQWADVLKDAGPKLHDLGVADFNNADGQWWITQSGNLKPDVLQTIADSSAKFGYAFKPIA